MRNVRRLFYLNMSGDFEEHGLDVVKLIALVKEKPILWNKLHIDFNDKLMRATAWRAVCTQLIENYEQFDDRTKKKIDDEVLKKWRSIKDNFTRNVKKIKSVRSSGSGEKVKKYTYYNQLTFLIKNINASRGGKNEQNEDSSSSADQEMSPLPGPSRIVIANRKRPRQAIDDTEATEQKKKRTDDTEVPTIPQENYHLSFFKGILPSVAKFTELETLTFQTKVLEIIAEMRFGKDPLIAQTAQSYKKEQFTEEWLE